MKPRGMTVRRRLALRLALEDMRTGWIILRELAERTLRSEGATIYTLHAQANYEVYELTVRLLDQEVRHRSEADFTIGLNRVVKILDKHLATREQHWAQVKPQLDQLPEMDKKRPYYEEMITLLNLTRTQVWALMVQTATLGYI